MIPPAAAARRGGALHAAPLLLALPLLVACQSAAPDPRVERATAAYHAAVAALSAPDAPAMEPGEAWFLQRLARERDDPALRALVARTEQRLASHAMARLLDPAAAPFPLPAAPPSGIQRLAVYVFAAAGAPPERAAAYVDAFTATPDTGYVLTHQWLALVWAEAVGLALPAAVAARAPGLLDRIAAEQRVDAAFSDLFAERAAILVAFGQPPRDDMARWVDIIVAAQPADGRWTSPPSPLSYDGVHATARHRWEHTTGFVAAALGYWLQRQGR